MSSLKIYGKFTCDFIRDKQRDELLLEWQPVQSNYLAAGLVSSKRVAVYNRQATITTDINLPSPCTNLTWNRDGMFLALSCWNGQVPSIFLWSSTKQRLANQELDMADMGTVSWLGWSPTDDILGIGFASGNLILLNKTTDKKIVVRGEHSTAVTDGAWSSDGILATCSLLIGSSANAATPKAGSSTIAFVSSNGESALANRDSPYGQLHRLQFAVSKFAPLGQRQQNTLCCVANRKTLVLINLEIEAKFLQYAFKSDYGELMNYTWYGDGYILLCFDKGVLIWVSSHPDEHGKELQHLNVFQNKVVDLAATVDGSRFGVCTDDALRLYYTDMARVRQSEAVVTSGGELRRLAWTTDNVLLAATHSSGETTIFLAKISTVGASWRSDIAFLVSLDSLHITNTNAAPKVLCQIACSVEPSLVAIGPNHFAACVNNVVNYYRWSANQVSSVPVTGDFLGTYEYSGMVQSVELGWDTAAILLSDGRITTHALNLENKEFVAQLEATVSLISGLNDVACLSLANKNLYFGTSNGYVGYLPLPATKHESFLQHSCGICVVTVKEADAIVAFIDIASEVYVYHLITDACLKVAGIPGSPAGVLFDWTDEETASDGDYSCRIIVHTEKYAHLHVVLPFTIHGTVLEEVKSSSGQPNPLEIESRPLSFSAGKLTSLSNGAILVKNLDVYAPLLHTDSVEDAVPAVEALIKLHCYRQAALLCRKYGLKRQLESIAGNCVRELDVGLALASYRECGRADKVQLLQPHVDLENSAQLAGYMSLVDGQPDLAQEWFLKAGDAMTVLDICSDLLEWEKAVTLAEKHAPDKVSYACQQHGLQLELMGDYAGAVASYEKALLTGGGDNEETERASKAGLAKVCLRTSDLAKGLILCRELRDANLVQECAEILEQDKRFLEAGRLYRESGSMEKAATCYLRAKDWKSAEDIINTLDAPHLKMQLAKTKELTNDFKGAVKCYEAAGDYDSMVRLYLEALHRTDLAIQVVEKNKSTEGAKTIANHFMKLKDFPSAIKYLIISNRGEDAFLTAQQYNQMDAFVDVVGENQSPALCSKIATYFENRKDWLRAAQFWVQSGSSPKAVALLLRELKGPSPPTNEDDYLELLVSATVKCNHTSTTETVSQFLLGNDDGVPKSEKYLLDLYLLSGQFGEADRITSLVADHYLRNGEYKEAHAVLFRTYSKIIATKAPVSGALQDLFALVHSHAVSTVMHLMKDHEKVARMLIRICSNISRFPKDAGRFLLSAVLECSRCQLQKTALSFALILMQPENKSAVTAKYESKILNILRKGDRLTDVPDELTDCPYGDHKLFGSSLFCPLCKLRLPFCILTGMHVVRGDLSLCPGCAMPAVFSQVRLALEKGLDSCPMCAASWTAENMSQSSAEQTNTFFTSLDALRLPVVINETSIVQNGSTEHE